MYLRHISLDCHERGEEIIQKCFGEKNCKFGCKERLWTATRVGELVGIGLPHSLFVDE